MMVRFLVSPALFRFFCRFLTTCFEYVSLLFFFFFLWSLLFIFLGFVVVVALIVLCVGLDLELSVREKEIRVRCRERVYLELILPDASLHRLTPLTSPETSEACPVLSGCSA